MLILITPPVKVYVPTGCLYWQLILSLGVGRQLYWDLLLKPTTYLRHSGLMALQGSWGACQSPLACLNPLFIVGAADFTCSLWHLAIHPGVWVCLFSHYTFTVLVGLPQKWLYLHPARERATWLMGRVRIYE